MPCKVLSLSCWWCVIFTINLAKQRYVCEEKMGLCSCVPMYNVHDGVLCYNTVRNVALGLCLVVVGHPAIARHIGLILNHLCSTHGCRSQCGPVKGFVQPSLGLRCSKSILQCILTTCPCFDNFEAIIFNAGVFLCHFIMSVITAVKIKTLSVQCATLVKIMAYFLALSAIWVEHRF